MSRSISPRRWLASAVASALVSFGLLSSVQAQEESVPQVAIEELTKDMQAKSGLFTLYTYDSNDSTKDPSKLIAVIPGSLIGHDLLMATSMSRGSLFGFPVGSDLVKFEVSGNMLLLVAPDIRMKQGRGAAIDSAVANTYTPRYLAAMPILSKTSQGDIAVDFGQLTSGGAAIYAQLSGANLGDMRRGLIVRYPNIKSFPDNVLIDTSIAVPSPLGGTDVGVSFSFRRLPELGGYTPRVADERVGYFTTVSQDWGASYSDRETLVRYIDRWNVKKKDPSLELSPPEKPITFIIEKNVPLQWRRFVAEGILDWNKAYEKVGIVGAIVVQQQTDDNEFTNIDPEDARYNFIRWIVTGNGFAMGPHRSDPRTGEILDADIVFDDSMVRYYHEDMQNQIGPGAWASDLGPDVLTFLEKNPAYIPAGITVDDVKGASDSIRINSSLTSGDAANLLLTESGEGLPTQGRAKHSPLVRPEGCSYATGMRHQMSMLRLMYSAASATPERKIPDRLLGEIIRNVVSHEVGHTLGLRHNFKASTQYSPDEIKQKRDSTDEATYASVMDYDALLMFPGDKLESLRHIVSPTIGAYDYWAIDYGYNDDDSKLGEIASRTNEPGLDYATDEDVMGLSSPDPTANRWDMSNDPLVWATGQSALADELLSNYETWAIKPDEPSYYLRNAFLTLLSQKTRYIGYAARVVGGQEFNRNRASDPGATAPLTLIEPKKQRDALEYLSRTIFSDDFLSVDADKFNKFAPSRNWDNEFGTPPARIDFPVHQVVLALQSSVLMQLTNPIVLQRVYDAEMKTKSDDKFTVAELIRRVREIVWGDLKADADYTDAKPMLSSVRRNLQKQYLSNMIGMASAQPGAAMSADIHSMVRYTLRDLSKQIALTLKNEKIDLASRAHLTEAQAQIDKALEGQDVNVNLMLQMTGNEEEERGTRIK